MCFCPRWWQLGWRVHFWADFFVHKSVVPLRPFLALHVAPCFLESLIFSQHGGLRAVTLLLWQMASQTQEVELPENQELCLGLVQCHFCHILFAQINHWAHSGSRRLEVHTPSLVRMGVEWGGEMVCVARLPCRKAHGMGDIVAVIFGKYGPPLLYWQVFLKSLRMILSP